jgi:hypothetical protein
MSATAGRTRLDLGAPGLVALAVAIAWPVAPLAAAPAAAAPEIRFIGFPEGLEALAREECRAAYDQAAEWFGTELTRPVTVRWSEDPDDLRRRGIRDPGTVAGLADADAGLILLSAAALGARSDRLHPVLLHEIAHLFVARATEGAEVLPPRWLNEGIAMLVSGEWDLGADWRASRASLLRDALAAGGPPPLRELEVAFPEGPLFHVAYAQSLSFTEWMVRRRGENGLRELLRRLDLDEDLDPAFQHVYGLTLEDAERAWKEDVGGPGWIRRVPSANTIVASLWALLALLMIVKWVRVRLQLRNSRDDGDPPPPAPPA